jgi:hypothetical protein
MPGAREYRESGEPIGAALGPNPRLGETKSSL